MRGSRQIHDLLGRISTLLAFLERSTYASRSTDPHIADFVFGNPHDMPVDGFTDALIRATEPKDKAHFAYKMNVQEACEAVADSLKPILGARPETDDVFMTAGTFAGLSVAIRALVDPGDEVVFLSPPWFFYEPMIRIAGATPVRVTIAPPTFELDVDAIDAAITPRTRAIILNTPHNPSGQVLDEQTVVAVADLLARRSREHGRPIMLLSDEAYREIVFSGARHVSPGAFYPDTLVLYTYGKTLLTPGERLGYIALPPTLDGREELRRAMFFSQVVGGWQFPNATLQYAVPELERLRVDVPTLEKRRDRLVSALRAAGYDVPLVPRGTFYIMVRSPIADDGAFTELLAKHDVFVGPGAIFELPGWFRLSVTASDAMIDRAIPGFERAIAEAR